MRLAEDKFGVSWQITPSILPGLLRDPVRAERVTKVYMQMKKFDIETLERAWAIVFILNILSIKQ